MSFFRKKQPSASQLGSSTSTSTSTTSTVALNAAVGGGSQVQIAQTPSQALAQLKASQASERVRDMGKENDAGASQISGSQSQTQRPQAQGTSPNATVNGPQSQGQPSQQPTGPTPAMTPSQNSTQSRQAYPWSARRLILPPPVTLQKPGVAPPTSPSPSPFPRYGHALPATATQSGELFLFGGLVRESARNDLYLFSTRDLSATLLQTAGEVPSPRVGHASALVSNVLIVWGGDTKTDPKSKPSDKQDDGLYLLNLVSENGHV
jgi:hypothetical protein